MASIVYNNNNIITGFCVCAFRTALLFTTVCVCVRIATSAHARLFIFLLF